MTYIFELMGLWKSKSIYKPPLEKMNSNEQYNLRWIWGKQLFRGILPFLKTHILQVEIFPIAVPKHGSIWINSKDRRANFKPSWMQRYPAHLQKPKATRNYLRPWKFRLNYYLIIWRFRYNMQPQHTNGKHHMLYFAPRNGLDYFQDHWVSSGLVGVFRTVHLTNPIPSGMQKLSTTLFQTTT